MSEVSQDKREEESKIESEKTKEEYVKNSDYIYGKGVSWGKIG